MKPIDFVKASIEGNLPRYQTIGIILNDSCEEKPLWFKAGKFLGGKFSYDVIRLIFHSESSYFVKEDEFSRIRGGNSSQAINPNLDEIYTDRQLFKCNIEKLMENVPNRNFPLFVNELDELRDWKPKPVSV
ncbi:MAG: hypothetical protein ABIE55_01070 [Candidatus Aenigmatarchaeota archaeon]